MITVQRKSRFDSCQGPIVALFAAIFLVRSTNVYNIYKFPRDNFHQQDPSTFIGERVLWKVRGINLAKKVLRDQAFYIFRPLGLILLFKTLLKCV